MRALRLLRAKLYMLKSEYENFKMKDETATGR